LGLTITASVVIRQILFGIMLVVTKSTQDEKNLAMKEMQKLDPKNKELFAAK
jgi:hypothetical protein